MYASTKMEFNALGETHYVTVDGSKGTKGFVTNVLESRAPEFDVFYSCGPVTDVKSFRRFLS
ncbi:Dihydroorotate dehydrogenase B (NAD(+)), electron transfer subunit OS=Lysinibacillus sphaericus OX=1421 GN=pyrK_2 PE=3 SV=1 [Lysinibacillus sphaericus]